MKGQHSIGIGLLGLGVVGSGVARILMEKSDAIASQVGCPLLLRRVLVKNLVKQRSPEVESSLLTTSAVDILEDHTVDIVIEVIGGEVPATEFIRRALAAGKHVVTANKEVMAKHGPELLALAGEHGVNLFYEASVGAGIPLIASFQGGLLANQITAIHAIINGTTNYILTQMAREGLDYQVALEQAQALGYAEPDPTNDIEGIDAAYKLAILASLAFHTQVHPRDVYTEGISRLKARDFRYAQELGYAIKLLAVGRQEDDTIQVRVHPAFVPQDFLLAKVDGVFNAVQVEGDLIGRMLFYGRGAGAMPTTSAVVADVIEAGRNIRRGISRSAPANVPHRKGVRPLAELETRYYLRMEVADKPGVLAQIAKVLGDYLISIASVIQKETDVEAKTAEIVIMTHPAREAALAQALQALERLDVVREVGNFVRVEA